MERSGIREQSIQLGVPLIAPRSNRYLAASDIWTLAMNLQAHNLLASIVEARPRTWIEPSQFFISWNGVPTLAYRGFSPVLLAIKREIEAAVPGLKPENAGARWPKTTLGALRDGRMLALDEARTLRQICDEWNPARQEEKPIALGFLSVVVFQCRSLERRLLTSTFQLRDEGSSPTDHEPPPEHLQEVQAVMDQFSAARLEEYLPYLQGPRNQELHYRETHIEATLVFDLREQQPEVIDSFIEAVDAELPGAYRWFESASRHITVRGLA